MILLDTDGPDWQIAAQELSDKGALYSAFRTVKDKTQAEDILSGSWLEETVPFHFLMAFSIVSDTLPEETARLIQKYMWDTRLEQVYPILPVDLISDFVVINRMVSHRDIFYRVNTDGSVSVASELQFHASPLKCNELFI
jgi:hypothetical protein